MPGEPALPRGSLRHGYGRAGGGSFCGEGALEKNPRELISRYSFHFEPLPAAADNVGVNVVA